jgi:hypothetical protein
MPRKYLIILITLALLNLACAFQKPFTSRAISSPIRKLKQKLNDDDDGRTSPLAGFTGAFGVGANMVCDYSLYVIRTTGCNLVPKFGLEGLIFEQGASFAVIFGIVIWSALTKAKTGSGLPAGPAGLLGSAEGLSYLTVLVSIIVLVLNFSEFGGLTKSVCDVSEYSKPFSFI